MARRQHPSQMLRDALLAAESLSPLENLSVTDRSVLSTLVQYADWDTGENSRPGSDALARIVGVHPKSVSRSIGRLIKSGFVQRTRRAYPDRAAEYRIAFDFIENGAGMGNRAFPDG